MIQIPNFIEYLAGKGIPIGIEPIINNDYAFKASRLGAGECVITVGGFYKHGKVFIVPSVTTNINHAWAVFGRYGHLDNLTDFNTALQLIELNRQQWEIYQPKGYEIDPEWAKLMLEFGLIRVHTMVTYESVPRGR